MIRTVVPQLVANNGRDALRAAIADPARFVVEPEMYVSEVAIGAPFASWRTKRYCPAR